MNGHGSTHCYQKTETYKLIKMVVYHEGLSRGADIYKFGFTIFSPLGFYVINPVL